MSRTDVHRPLWVQAADPYRRYEFAIMHFHFVQEHFDVELGRHLVRRSAPCDLHLWERAPRAWSRCKPVFVGWRGVCGCRMCNGHGWARRERRRSRHQWKQLRRDLLGGAEQP